MTDMTSAPSTDDPNSAPGDQPASAPNSRRRFLGAIGAGVGAAVVAPSVVAAQVDDVRHRGVHGGRGRGGPRGDGGDGRPARDERTDAVDDSVISAGDDRAQRFTRLFDLPPFAEPSQELREALIECGRPGGMMDANDPLEVGPIRLITEPELSPDN